MNVTKFTKKQREECKQMLDTLMARVGAEKSYNDSYMLPEYTITSKNFGVLKIRYMSEDSTVDWFACQFKDIAKAYQFLGDDKYPGSFNKHSGKWNWDADNFDIFRTAIELIV